MGVVLVEVSGGIADITHTTKDVSVIHIDWDNVVADRGTAQQVLEETDWSLLPEDVEVRIKGMLAEIWDDLDEEWDPDIPVIRG